MQLSKFGALQKINNQVMMQRKGLIASRLHTQCGNMKKEEHIIIFIKATRNLNSTRKSTGSGNFAGPQIPTKNTNQKYQMHYQGLSAVLYSLDPDQNKLLEVLLSITIDFYLTKVK